MARKAKKPAAIDAADALPESDVTAIPPIDLSGFAPEEEDYQNMGDVLQIDPLRMKAMQAKGVDTLVTRCRVERWRKGGEGRSRLPGEYPPDLVTVAWLQKKWGHGRYVVRGCNSRGSYIAYGTANITEESDPNPEPSEAAHVNGNGAPTIVASADATFSEKLLLALLPALLQQRAAPPPDDSLREVMSVMGRMTAMQLQIQAANMLKNPAATSEQKDRTVELLKTILESQSKPAPPPPKQLGFQEFLPILTMGMNMGARMTGAPSANPTEKQLPPWLEILPSLADTVGVPLIATIAQAWLTPEKAKLVIEAINEHSGARKAEAEAEALVDVEPEE